MAASNCSAREFLEEPVVAQSIHPHRLVRREGHRHERLAAARRREELCTLRCLEPVDWRNVRAALHIDNDFHSEQLQIRRELLTDKRSRVTQCAAQQLCYRRILWVAVAGDESRATRCHCASVPPANSISSSPVRIRVECPSLSCNTHYTAQRNALCLCTRRAGRRRCCALESLAPLRSPNRRGTARRAPSCN